MTYRTYRTYRHRITLATVTREGASERFALFRRSEDGDLLRLRRDVFERDYEPVDAMRALAESATVEA